MNPKHEERAGSFFAQPGVLAGKWWWNLLSNSSRWIFHVDISLDRSLVFYPSIQQRWHDVYHHAFTYRMKIVFATKENFPPDTYHIIVRYLDLSRLSAVIGGAVVGLLCAILVVMFIVYRMRKKDEGSYALDEPRRSPAVQPFPKPGAPHHNREFYAWNERAKKTLLIVLKFITRPSKEHTITVTNLRYYLTGPIKWWTDIAAACHVHGTRAPHRLCQGSPEERRSERRPISRYLDGLILVALFA